MISFQKLGSIWKTSRYLPILPKGVWFCVFFSKTVKRFSKNYRKFQKIFRMMKKMLLLGFCEIQILLLETWNLSECLSIIRKFIISSFLINLQIILKPSKIFEKTFQKIPKKPCNSDLISKTCNFLKKSQNLCTHHPKVFDFHFCFKKLSERFRKYFQDTKKVVI